MLAVHRLRGNVERWLVEPPEVPDEARPLVEAAVAAARAELGDEHVARLYALPEQAEWDGALFCHASPLSDIDSFAPGEDKPGRRSPARRQPSATTIFTSSSATA